MKVLLCTLGLIGAVVFFQGCNNGSNPSSVPASQYYAPQVAGAPSQGKPLSTCQTNPGSVPIVKCRPQDHDATDNQLIQQMCQNRVHNGGPAHQPSDDNGIVCCIVTSAGSTTECLSLQGVFAHFGDPLSYLGVCTGASPTATPLPPFPSPTPLPPFQ